MKRRANIWRRRRQIWICFFDTSAYRSRWILVGCDEDLWTRSIFRWAKWLQSRHLAFDEQRVSTSLVVYIIWRLAISAFINGLNLEAFSSSSSLFPKSSWWAALLFLYICSEWVCSLFICFFPLQDLCVLSVGIRRLCRQLVFGDLQSVWDSVCDPGFAFLFPSPLLYWRWRTTAVRKAIQWTQWITERVRRPGTSQQRSIMYPPT